MMSKTLSGSLKRAKSAVRISLWLLYLACYLGGARGGFFNDIVDFSGCGGSGNKKWAYNMTTGKFDFTGSCQCIYSSSSCSCINGTGFPTQCMVADYCFDSDDIGNVTRTTLAHSLNRSRVRYFRNTEYKNESSITYAATLNLRRYFAKRSKSVSAYLLVQKPGYTLSQEGCVYPVSKTDLNTSGIEISVPFIKKPECINFTDATSGNGSTLDLQFRFQVRVVRCGNCLNSTVNKSSYADVDQLLANNPGTFTPDIPCEVSDSNITVEIQASLTSSAMNLSNFDLNKSATLDFRLDDAIANGNATQFVNATTGEGAPLEYSSQLDKLGLEIPPELAPIDGNSTLTSSDLDAGTYKTCQGDPTNQTFLDRFNSLAKNGSLTETLKSAESVLIIPGKWYLVKMGLQNQTMNGDFINALEDADWEKDQGDRKAYWCHQVQPNVSNVKLEKLATGGEASITFTAHKSLPAAGPACPTATSALPKNYYYFFFKIELSSKSDCVDEYCQLSIPISFEPIRGSSGDPLCDNRRRALAAEMSERDEPLVTDTSHNFQFLVSGRELREGETKAAFENIEGSDKKNTKAATSSRQWMLLGISAGALFAAAGTMFLIKSLRRDHPVHRQNKIVPETRRGEWAPARIDR